MLLRWPRLLRGQLHTATLAALAGLTLGIIESAVYAALYVPNHSDGLVLYRFTAPVLMHTIASFIVGFGINRRLLDSVNGVVTLLDDTKRFLISAMILHAIFNITVVVLAVADILDYD